MDKYEFPNGEAEYARQLLAGYGYTENFEDLSYLYYEGNMKYCAQNSDGLWAETSYSYGTCERCGSVEDDLDAKERLDTGFVGGLTEKPVQTYW